MREIHLVIVGLPAPQGSKVRMPNGATVDGTSKTGRANLAAWREAVRKACRDHLEANPARPLAEPVRVEIHFRFPPTASDPYRFWHASTPDIDKTIRSTFDSLVHGGLLADDRFVCDVRATKTYVSPWRDEHGREVAIGCDLIVEPLGEQEAATRETMKARAADARKAARRQPAAETQAALL